MSTIDPTSSQEARALRERPACGYLRSSLRTTWMLPILVSMFASLAIVGVHFTSTDVGAGHRMLSDLHELQTLQTRCERELASVDTGDPAQRTAILARLGELEGRWRSMASKSRPFGIGEHEEMDQLGAAYGAALAGKRKRMEEYVAERAAYERACALLPDVVLDLMNRAPKLSRSPEVQNQLDEVLSRIAAGEIAADPAEESKLDAALASLKRLRGRFALDEAAVLERLTNHIVFMQLKATAMRTVRDEMHRTRLDYIGQRLFASYNSELGERSARANQWRLTAYGLSALLVGGLAFGVYRHRKNADEQEAILANVKELVRTKTEQLTMSNRELAMQLAEHRRAEIEAGTARDAAQAASRTKSEFLANMSHEIRTPMTAIIGFSESLMSSDASSAERAEAITTIRRNGEHLLQIIDDILDTSKIEAGKLEIVRMPFSPHEAVAEVKRIMAPKAAGKGIELDVEFAGPIPRTIVTDPVRLKQVLLNLVGNAVKFTESGSVTVRVECLRTPEEMAARQVDVDQPACLLFTIKDTGIGLTPAHMERLFRPFTQADNTTARMFGGTGLGLSICKHLVELMHGSIVLKSELGVGSEFSFTTDVGPVEEIEWIESSLGTPETTVPGGALDSAQWPSLTSRVLLAEDAEDSKRLIVHVLESAGATVTAVGDGQIACERALEAKRAGQGFDVVLMDMQMPVLDGYRAVKALRDAGYDAPIVALTASATTGERQRCVEAGCDEFCAKPIDWGVLLATIGRLVPARPALETEALARPALEVESTAIAAADPAAHPSPDASVGSAVTSLFMDAHEDEGLVELMRMFIDDLSNDMLSMRLAWQSGEMEIIARLAHQLKGTAGSYGFPAITEQAARVEECVRQAAPSADVQSAIAALQDLCMQVQTREGKLFTGSASPRRPAA